MKALSFRQPWGFAVTHLGKRIENRVWRWLKHGHAKFIEAHPKPGEYFAIHASSTKPEDYDIAGVEQAAGIARNGLPEQAFLKGQIIGVAQVVDVLRSNGEIVDGTADKPFPHYVMCEEDRIRYLADESHTLTQLLNWWLGPFALVLDHVRVLPTPIPASGALEFWVVPPEMEAKIVNQLQDLRSFIVGDPAVPPGVVEVRNDDQRSQMTLFDEPAPKKSNRLH